MRRHLSRAGAVAAAACCTVGAAAALAASSNISIESHNHEGPNGHFNGQVTSNESSCKKHVKVYLYRDAPGGGKHYKLNATDRTNDHGRWAVHFADRIPKGKYYATSGGAGECPLVKTTPVHID